MLCCYDPRQLVLVHSGGPLVADDEDATENKTVLLTSVPLASADVGVLVETKQEAALSPETMRDTESKSPAVSLPDSIMTWPMFLACQRGHTALVQVLLKYKPNLKKPTKRAQLLFGLQRAIVILIFWPSCFKPEPMPMPSITRAIHLSFLPATKVPRLSWVCFWTLCQIDLVQQESRQCRADLLPRWPSQAAGVAVVSIATGTSQICS